MNCTIYTTKEKKYQFFSKTPSASKQSPPSSVNNMEFIAFFLYECSLLGIIKSKFTSRNEIYEAEFWK